MPTARAYSIFITGNHIVNAVKKWRAGSLSKTKLEEMEANASSECPSSGELGSNDLDQFVAALQIVPVQCLGHLAAKPKRSFVDY